MSQWFRSLGLSLCCQTDIALAKSGHGNAFFGVGEHMICVSFCCFPPRSRDLFFLRGAIWMLPPRSDLSLAAGPGGYRFEGQRFAEDVINPFEIRFDPGEAHRNRWAAVKKRPWVRDVHVGSWHGAWKSTLVYNRFLVFRFQVAYYILLYNLPGRLVQLCFVVVR